MAQYSDKNILDSPAEYLCFASSSILRPDDIHGNKQVAPMSAMSALASALYKHEPKLATTLATQIIRAREIYRQTHLIPFLAISLDDQRVVCPFLVRRHTQDPVDNSLTIHSTQAIFRRIVFEAYMGVTNLYAIESPIDADDVYHRIVSLLPENVIIHKEIRYEDDQPQKP